GDYGPALARLERLSGERADALRAEVLSILRRSEEAAEAISRTENPYLRALMLGEDVELQSPYFRERLATYRALERDDADAALASLLWCNERRGASRRARSSRRAPRFLPRSI